MSLICMTTHSGRIYHTELEEEFVYNPLKGRYDSEDELETSSSSESACSEEEEVSRK